MLIIFLVVLGTSIWVYIDARNIGVKKGQLKGVADMGPIGWLAVCLGLWIVGFPYYLLVRSQYKKLNPPRPAIQPLAVGSHVATDANSSPLPPVSLAPDFDDQLRKLAKLKEEGIVTEKEFIQEKKRILGLKQSAIRAPEVVPCAKCGERLRLNEVERHEWRYECPFCKEWSNIS
ncbi:MAG: hypothetical protein PHV34_17145 [Verrucomicrobiae bacterium]|nr:hypothetical protein [Verrucomicrobiae bacterium]